MLAKRVFLGVLFFAALVMISGCATTGNSVDDYSTQYRNASDECLKFGYRRDSYDYHQCIEDRVGSKKGVLSPGRD